MEKQQITKKLSWLNWRIALAVSGCLTIVAGAIVIVSGVYGCSFSVNGVTDIKFICVGK